MKKNNPKAAIIAVGSEILQGKIIDTNSGSLSSWLTRRGIEVTAHFSAPDTPEPLAELIAYAAPQGDILFFTGGLGPTQDDLTLEAVARHLNRPLVFQQEMWDQIRRFFRRFGHEVPESNRKQALLPEGGIFLPNPRGTAPGVVLEAEGKLFILLPGPPRETLPLLDEAVDPILTARFRLTPRQEKILRVYNTGESRVQEILNGCAIKGELGIYFKREGWIELHFAAPRAGEPEGVKEILASRGLLVTEDEPLSLLVLKELINQGVSLGFAESLTAGNLTAEIVQHPGASAVLKGGITAYSNEVKAEILGVRPSTLETYGAVSEETVREMAQGAKERLKADAVVAVSGIAGPDGGSEEKPVGTVCFAFDTPRGVLVRRKRFGGDRSQVLRRCIMYAYSRLYRILTEPEG